MSIRASSSHQIDTLIADLSADDVTREAAVARLTVIGARAVDRLAALVQSPAAPQARAAALRALEAIRDARAVDVAVRAIADPDQAVAIAAVGAARAFMRGARGASVVDALTTAALDRGRPERVRVGALRALLELERSTIAPLVRKLSTDSSAVIRNTVARAHSSPRGSRVVKSSIDEQTLPEDLPEDARELHAIVAAVADTAPLPALLRVVERVREREASVPPARRREWTMVRAAAHVALANRGSRLALYDLREALQAAEAPLPVEFLAALSRVGDASCLEPIAAAYARTADSRRETHDWWRQHLAGAFRMIVKRTKMTRRHALMRRIEARRPDAIKELMSGGAGGSSGSGGKGR